MKLDEIPPLYRAAWSVYEALRRLGFTDDDVTFVAGQTVLIDGTIAPDRYMHVVLETQGQRFTVTVAPLDRPLKDAQAMLDRLCASIRDGSTSDDVLRRIWAESEMGSAGHFALFCNALLERGFTFPAMAN